MASVKGIAVADWVLGITVPTAEAHAPVNDIRQNFIWVTLLLTLVASGFTWWMLRRELSPLLTTAKLLAQTAQSNTPPLALPVTGQNEIGELVGGFNQLLHILGQREAELLQSEAFKSAILNAMSSHIAVLDHNGVIVAVNDRWSSLAMDNSNLPGHAAPHTSIGVNYLDMCHCPGDIGESSAQTAHNGILQVLQGKLPSFSLDYPCHAPGEQRWFHLTATPLESGVVVVHTNISEQKLNQIQLARYRDHLEDMVAQQTDSLEHSNAALRDNEAKLYKSAQLLEQTGAVAKVGGWEIDLNTTMVDWTTQVFRIFELEPCGLQSVDQASSQYLP
ncbi:MAG: PAS domain-containing protein, partial [Rhodoferax sp.]|nr:PAS domain-containing protein [Rhodoferax sp.]